MTCTGNKRSGGCVLTNTAVSVRDSPCGNEVLVVSPWTQKQVIGSTLTKVLCQGQNTLWVQIAEVLSPNFFLIILGLFADRFFVYLSLGKSNSSNL